MVLTDAEDDSLAGLPLYITAGHPSAVLFAHPLGLNLWLPLYISTGHFFEDADSDWLLIKTKCRLWLFAKLNGTTSKQEKWCSSWLSPITKYNKSVIMTSTQWKKNYFFFIYAWSSLLPCSLDFVLKGPFETGMYSRKLLKVKWEQSIRLLCQ